MGSAKRRGRLTVLVIGVMVAASAGTSPLGAQGSAQLCQHPHPCGNEWPEGLTGPFELKEVLNVRVPSFDGVTLEGWIGLPDVPAGVRVPVVLTSSPYFGWCHVNVFNPPVVPPFCAGSPGDPGWWTDPPGEVGIPPYPDGPEHWDIAPAAFVARGYATAFFNIRGSGNSGGCWEGPVGPSEQRDQAMLVEWLAAQDWSNGRVGMGGVSYVAGAAMSAAVESPPSLKAVVVAGVVSDYYTMPYSPQGASLVFSPAALGGWYADFFLPQLARTPPAGVTNHASVLPGRLCPSLARVVQGFHETATDFRDADFYTTRRLIDRFDEVTAAVLLAHGFGELGHGFQEDEMWRTLTAAPKRQIEGFWGHHFPSEPGTLDPSLQHDEWAEVVFDWFDYWLKGLGSGPENLGRAEYADQDGIWRSSDAWPPTERREEVLYLTSEALAATPAEGARTFLAGPNPGNDDVARFALTGDPDMHPAFPIHALCGNLATGAVGLAGLRYDSEPVASQTTIAGNPFLYLDLESDLPGGVFVGAVIDLAPDAGCDAAGRPRGAQLVSWGAADLRFSRGNYTGSAFPVGTPTHLRVDLQSTTWTIEAGHRLAVILSYRDSYVGQPYFPNLTVHAGEAPDASQIVLPVVDGSLGGSPAGLAYPRRPFVP